MATKTTLDRTVQKFYVGDKVRCVESANSAAHPLTKGLEYTVAWVPEDWSEGTNELISVNPDRPFGYLYAGRFELVKGVDEVDEEQDEGVKYAGGFKPGTKVVCKDTQNYRQLTLGKTYVVLGEAVVRERYGPHAPYPSDYVYIEHDNGNVGAYYACLFEAYKEPPMVTKDTLTLSQVFDLRISINKEIEATMDKLYHDLSKLSEALSGDEVAIQWVVEKLNAEKRV